MGESAVSGHSSLLPRFGMKASSYVAITILVKCIRCTGLHSTGNFWCELAKTTKF